MPDIDPAEGDGPGGAGRGCHEGPEPPGCADQVTGMSWESEPGIWKDRAALPAPEPRLTCTATVTLCPAGSVPP